jgi:LuxR family quorum-sensing system transcriptional regulator CciR
MMALHAHEEARLKAGAAPHEPVTLTKRQHECLALAGKGKSDFAIGQILQISARTAHHTVENAKKRYHVSHRIQAVVLALFDGQLSVSDLRD